VIIILIITENIDVTPLYVFQCDVISTNKLTHSFDNKHRGLKEQILRGDFTNE
jgi:hypothetical protein